MSELQIGIKAHLIMETVVLCDDLASHGAAADDNGLCPGCKDPTPASPGMSSSHIDIYIYKSIHTHTHSRG